MSITIFSIALLQLFNAVFSSTELFSLNIIHYNDFHAHYMPVDSEGKECSVEDEEKNLCFGGLARIKTMIDTLQRENTNTIVVNAGDFSQGSLWATEFGWKAFEHFVGKIPHTAVVIGIHELDGGPEALGDYLKNTNFPYISCNIDASNVTVVENKFNKSLIIEVGSEKVGIIGYISTIAKYVSSPGLLQINDELNSVAEEAKRLTELGVKIIIATGSAGYDRDKEIANIPEVDIVVGGKSHTFLYTGTPPSNERPDGSYPTVVKRNDLTVGLVTQAYAWGKYVGFIRVDFDSEGVAKSWKGNPVLLDSTVIPDREMTEELDEWNENLTAILKIEVGKSYVYLDGGRNCRAKECNFGNVITDAFVFTSLKFVNDFEWNYASIAIVNAGSLRASFDPRIHPNGGIHKSDVYSMLPYKTFIAFVEIKGEYLKSIFEFSASQMTHSKLSPTDPQSLDGRFLQVSGLKIVIDICKPPGFRVIRILVLCSECLIPKYSLLEDDYYYRVVVPEFLIRGGDGYTIISEKIISMQATGLIDSDVFVEYMKMRGPLTTGIEHRIIILGQTGCKANTAVTFQLKYYPCCYLIVNSLLLFNKMLL